MSTKTITNVSAILLATTALWACNSDANAESTNTVTSTTLDVSSLADGQVISYGVGYQIGTQLFNELGNDLDPDMFRAGVADVISGIDPQVAEEVFAQSIERMNEKRQTELATQTEAAKASGVAFLAENAEKEGITVTDSGLQYQVIESSGSGVKPVRSDRVRVHYTGQLTTGEIFDSSVERGSPAEFPLQGVIPGWTEALQLMEVGDKWRLFIPSELAYGDASPTPAIPPHSVLVFEVELLDVL